MHAASCPDVHRFVDFGFTDSDGILRRGGSIFRAFDVDNKHLLIPEDTICLEVDELAKDGRLLPVPVVASIQVDMTIATLDMQELRLRSVKDVQAVTQANLAPHQTTLAQDGSISARGSNHLCVTTPNSDTISCQFLSPYQTEAPLVIYCDADSCTMPALARDTQVIVSAIWSRGEATKLETLGLEISEKLQSLYGFLADHT
jgi:hypothetical protein